MIKLYKYGFWVLILSIFTLFNFYRISKSNSNNKIEILKSKNKKRIVSLFTSCNISNRKIDPIRAVNIISQQISDNLLYDSTLVILLSDFKCSKCQVKELKRLDSLKSFLSHYGVNILGITTKHKKDLTARQKKIAKINVPIFWTDDNTFFYELSFSSEYPQLFYIANGTVISAFLPITMDDEFSKKYYSNLISMISRHN